MVSANWRKNWPEMPGMKAAGMNTARQHQRDGDQRAADLVHRGSARPCAASSLARMIALDILDDDDGVVDHDADASTRPNSVRLLIE